MLKFAHFQTIEAKIARTGHGLMKDAHRHAFEYDPQPGYLYVRSRAISSRCNDNFDEFPAPEIAVSYRTFVGKPVFINHHNANHRRARGVIVDAVLHEDTNPDGSPDTWVEVLMEVDAINFPILAEKIVKGEIDRTSMGCDVAYSKCSYCGNKAVSPVEYCDHIRRHKGRRIRRRTASGDGMEDVLVREVCYGLRFFENSLLVEDPADPTAFFLGVESGDDLIAAGRKTASVTAKEERKTRTPEWDEEDEQLHPRDHGKFTDSGASGPTRVPDGTTDTAPTQEGVPEEAEPTTHGPTEDAGEAEVPAAPGGNDPHSYEDEDGTWHPHPETTGIGTKEDPVVTPSVEDAAKALSLGLHVELRRAPEISTLLDRLAQMIEEAKAEGTKLQIDLCNVTVKGTNLFCIESKGIPRAQMPQLKSLPEGLDPNGRAMAEVQPNADGEYDIQPQFLQHLKDLGYEAEEIDYPAANLKATQSQLNAGKVAGITDAILNKGVNVNKEPIFVSEDDYIVDGHHRWAASVSADWSDGDVGDVTMPVWKIKGLDIITLLDLSNKFAAEWGFKQQDVAANNAANVPGVKAAASKGCSNCGPTLDEMNAHAVRKMALAAAEALVKEALPPGLNDISSQRVTWRPSKTARPGGYEALIWDLPELDRNSHTNLNLFVSPARDSEAEAEFEMGLWTRMSTANLWQLEAHLLQPNEGPAALYLRPGGPANAYSVTETMTGSLAAAQDRCEVMGWDLVARHFRGRRMASGGSYGTLWQTSTGYVHRSRNCPHIATDGANAWPVPSDTVLEGGVVSSRGIKACSTCFPSAPTRRTADLNVSWPVTDDPCTACAGSGEQGTGHECYLCDGSGMGAVERASRLRGMTNDNPENGLIRGRDDARGIKPEQAEEDFAFAAALNKFAYQYPDGRRLDVAELRRIAIEEGFLTAEQVANICASNKSAYTDLEKVLRKHLYSMWAKGLIDIGPFHDYLGPDDTWAAAEERSKAPAMAIAASLAGSCIYQHPQRIETAHKMLEAAKDQPKESRREHMRSIANGAIRNIEYAMESCPWCSPGEGKTATLGLDGMETLIAAIENSTPVEVLYWHSPGWVMTAKGVPVGGGPGTLSLSSWPDNMIAWDDIISVTPAAAKAASLDKAAVGPLDTPITNYGLNYDRQVAAQPLVRQAAAWDGWDRLAVHEVPLADLWATEGVVSSLSIDKVVSGAEPFRTGYAAHVAYDHEGRALLIDGNHRAAMYAALGYDTMPAHVATVSHITARASGDARWRAGDANDHPASPHLPLTIGSKTARFNVGDHVLLELGEDQRPARGVLKEWGTEEVTFEDGRSFPQDDITKAFQSNPGPRKTAATWITKGEMIAWKGPDGWRMGTITRASQGKPVSMVEFGTTKSIKVEDVEEFTYALKPWFSDASKAEMIAAYRGPYPSKEAVRLWALPYTVMQRNDMTHEERERYMEPGLRRLIQRQREKYPPHGFPTVENGGITGGKQAGRDEIPPPPGESRVPSGCVAMYHRTWKSNLDSIRQGGLTINNAKGESYGEPNMVWGSGAPVEPPGDSDRIIVEYVLHWDRVLDRESFVIGAPNRADNGYVRSTDAHIAVSWNIPPSDILAIHEAWHTNYRYMIENHMEEEVCAGAHDHLLNDPHFADAYGPAIAKIKAEHGHRFGAKEAGVLEWTGDTSIDRSLWWQDGPDGESHLQIVLDAKAGAWWYEVYRVDADLTQRLVADGGPFPTVDEAERVSRNKARAYSTDGAPMAVAAALMVRTPAPGA